ncbi:MAG: ribonuclease HII, partial [Lachnospiraceae bacterium]|nr:ribonuclease HII [Lachnospiraceae bacterium]
MEKKISEIKELFQAAVADELPELIEAYKTDLRSGVQSLVAGAIKRQHAVAEERKRLEGMKRYEYQYAQAGIICGIDEAGRGPLAGPVV